MLWFKKRQEAVGLGPAAGEIVPAELPVALDADLFRRHFENLLATAEQDGGIESYLLALNAKQHLFAAILDRDRAGSLGMAEIERLLDRVSTARRRLYPGLQELGIARAAALARKLLTGNAPLGERLQDFVHAVAGSEGMDRESRKTAARVRRAAWDFAAEMLHFSDPVRFPLMSRWVWDQGTQSGALREFLRGNDALREIPFSNNPGLFEGARLWLAERIAEEGVYRDVPFWIDLVLAQAYTAYFRSVTDGSLGADFRRGVSAHEQLRKLLGIDTPRNEGRSRVKKGGIQDSGVKIQ